MILAVCPNPSVDTYVYLNSFVEGGVNRVRQEKAYPGGKGTHLALGVNELGEQAVLLGFWAGSTGQWVKQQLEKKGIICHGVEVDGLTRRCWTFKTGDSFDDSEILGVGPEISSDDINRFYEIYDRLLNDASVVAMSGSWPKGAPDESYAILVKKAKEKDIPVVVDAAGVQFKEAIVENPDAIHLNKKEMAQFTGIQNIRGMMIHLHNMVGISAVTDGKNGLYYGRGNLFLHGNIALSSVDSAVGSGDALTAGLSVSIKRGYNDIETVKLAVACGAANCLRNDLGMFYKKDVDRLLDEVTVDKIEISVS